MVETGKKSKLQFSLWEVMWWVSATWYETIEKRTNPNLGIRESFPEDIKSK